MVSDRYRRNMRLLHGWIVLCLLVGAPVTVFSAPAAVRVVSTFLCTDEYIFRLLPRERIAALSFEATDRRPLVSTIADAARGIPAIRPDGESVLALRPDLVVMYQGTMPALRAELSAAGIPILDVPWATSLDEVRRTTRWLGEKLGTQSRAEALLARMEHVIVLTRRMTARPPIRTLVYEPNGYAPSGAFTDEVMAIAGLMDVAPSLRPSRALTLPVEAVVAQAPELLIFSGDEFAQASRANFVQHHPALAALKNKSFHAWANLTAFLCPGPWSLEAAPQLAALGNLARGAIGSKR